MWIASKSGFFSIVDKNGAFNVRARFEPDLHNLMKISSIKKEIVIIRQSDYQFRIFVDSLELGQIMVALGKSIDYDNFKDMIHENEDQVAKLPAYENLWINMLEVSEIEKYKKDSGDTDLLFLRQGKRKR